MPDDRRLPLADAHAQRGDAAALVEAIRFCSDRQQPIPGWIIDALECLLGEFVVLGGRSKYLRVQDPLFSPWAREYPQALVDFMVADKLEANRRVYGMTRAEAIDEAVCYYRRLSPDIFPTTAAAIEKTWKRARQRAQQGWFQREPTRFEVRLFEQFDPSSGPSPWWIINASRVGDKRGEWRERPELLARFTPKELERRAAQVATELHERARVGTKPAKI